MPPTRDPVPPGEEIELAEAHGPFVKVISGGPPEPQAGSSGAELNPKTVSRNEKKFKFTYCHPHNYPHDPLDGEFPVGWAPPLKRPGENLPKVISECHREDFEGVYFGVSVYGKFHYIYHHWVWLNDNQWDCHKWGEDQPAKVQCKKEFHEPPQGSAAAVHGPISVFGEYRFAPESADWAVQSIYTTCLTEGGELYPNPRLAGDAPLERPIIVETEWVIAGAENCNWK
jgi:hypothetical protein